LKTFYLSNIFVSVIDLPESIKLYNIGWHDWIGIIFDVEDDDATFLAFYDHFSLITFDHRKSLHEKYRKIVNKENVGSWYGQINNTI
jgi:hypothetical protein